MPDSDHDRESRGSNLVKALYALAALITAVTGFLAWWSQNRSHKDSTPPPVMVGETPPALVVRETPVNPDPFLPPQVPDLTGVWFGPKGGAVNIGQIGTNIYMNSSQLLEMGMFHIGWVEAYDDGGHHLARLQVETTTGATLSLLVEKGAMRMEGSLTDYKGTVTPIYLTRGTKR
jgi:hypothetical protein